MWAQKNGEAVGPVGGETSVPRFLAVVHISNLWLLLTSII